MYTIYVHHETIILKCIHDFHIHIIQKNEKRSFYLSSRKWSFAVNEYLGYFSFLNWFRGKGRRWILMRGSGGSPFVLPSMHSGAIATHAPWRLPHAHCAVKLALFTFHDAFFPSRNFSAAIRDEWWFWPI